MLVMLSCLLLCPRPFLLLQLEIWFVKVSTPKFNLRLASMHWIHSSISDLKFLSPIKCSVTKRLEILIVLHICSFLMSYDSSYKSLGDSETVVLCSHMKQSVQRDVLWFLWVNCIFNCIIHLMACILASILNP